MKKMLPLTKQGLLNRAEKHIFSTGLNDGTSHLCNANMKYGLAKMHYVQDKYGFAPDATFITTPDETVSRNAQRWEQGISYGGRLSWGNGREKFTILDVMPNCCGMLVGGLHDLPKPRSILGRVFDLEQKASYINDVRVKWDFYKGNHFIDVFRVDTKEPKLKLPKYAVIMHAGCPELKGETEKGMGLYWHESNQLKEMCKIVKTPFGPMYILRGHDAVDYHDFHMFAEDFAKKRRELAFREIFYGGKILINHTHQGLLNMNEITLGCQMFHSKDQLLPVSIRADLPSYLVRGVHNFTPHQMDLLGFTSRADELGVYNRLNRADVLPHGGGYAFPDALSVEKVFEMKDKRYFKIEMANSVGKKILSNMREMEFTYRGREVMQRCLDIGMCEIAAVLDPVYTIKI
ncbi:hypothetical protein JW898_02450 [Candidatus Woesearchaeota archaeon]|nr:hypothetical protein [Candidatus Woesearchaeota archaeon]